MPTAAVRRSVAAAATLIALWLASNSLRAQEAVPPPTSEELAKRVRDLEEMVRRLQADSEKKTDKPAKPPEPAAPAEPKPPEVPPFVEVGSDLNLKAVWREGLWLETKNRDFAVHIGGRFDVDGAWFAAGERLQDGPGGVGDLKDAVNFRRARIRFDGVAYEILTWVAEFDFAPAIEGDVRHPGLTDVYFDITRLPVVGNFRVGHFREPFSMEGLTSGNSLVFLERSAAFDAFDPFRNMGMMLFNSVLDDRASWSLGIFRTNSRNTGDVFDVGDGECSETGRLTCLPWYVNEGQCLLHLGAAYSHRSYNPNDDPARFRAFPSIRTGRYLFADTGDLRVESVDLINLEAAVKVGPVVVQSEYYQAWVNDALIDGELRNPSFNGWYVQASWMLTGEQREYRRTVPATNVGVFDRPRPFENFFFVKTEEEGPWWRRCALGTGAWEVAARYCYLNLNDPSQGVNKQIYQDVTLGLNWYLSVNTKVQFNYIIADRDFPSEDNDGVAHIVGLRFHHDY